MILPLRSLSLLGCVFFGLATGLAAEVRLAGSDLLGEHLEPVLEVEAKNRTWPLETSFTGSLSASEAFASGEVDLAILAMPEGIEASSKEARAWPLAFETVAFLVHADNPIREVDLTQLGNMFGIGADTSRWGQLGATGNWENRPLRLHALRNSSSLALEIFRSRVLGSRDLSESITYWEDAAALEHYVATTPEAVALTAANPQLAGPRALSVAASVGSGAYAPTPTTILYGDYPLSLGYYLQISQSPSEEALAVARFLLGDSVASTLGRSGYVPTPATERRQFVIELDVGG
jgi:ABC-type phosphate transport system substrate-binding protein